MSVDPEEAKRAIELFDRAQQLGEEAAGLGQRLGNQGVIARANRSLESITSRQIQAEEKLQSVQKSNQSRLTDEQRKREKILALSQQLGKQLLEVSGEFDGGRAITPDQRQERETRRTELLNRLKGLAVSQGDLSAVLALEATVDTSGIQNQLAEATRNFRLKVPVDIVGLERLTGEQIFNPEQLSKALDKSVEIAQSRAGEFVQSRLDTSEISNQRALLDDALRPIENLLGQQGRPLGRFTSDFRELTSEMQRLGNASNLSKTELDAIGQRIADLQGRAQPVSLTETIFGSPGTRTNELQTALTALQNIAKLQAQLSQRPLADIQTQANDVASTIGATDFSGFQLGANLTERMAENAERINKAFSSASVPATNRMFGGRLSYFAHGGRGLDTVPAMLSPGEFVVNPKSTGKFFSQLQAINAGQQPVFRESGGNVTNNNFGDINVTSKGSSRATAREIVHEINRELRQGTSRLRQ